MGDRDDGAGVLLQVLLEPQDALRVEVVGGLVEQQQVGLLQEQLAEGDPAPLATGQGRHVGVRRRAAQRVHRLLELAVQVPGVLVLDLLLELAHLLHELVGVVGRHLLGDLVVLVEQLLRLGDALLDVAEDGLVLVELRLLGEDADGEPGHQAGLAVGDLLHPGHDLQQGRLAGAVRAHDTDLRAGEKAQRDVVEDDLVTVRLADGAQAVNELGHVLEPTYCRRYRTCGHRLRQGKVREGSSMALAVNRAGVILEKCDMSNHRPGSVKRCAAGTCQHTCPADTIEKCPHAWALRCRRQVD